MIQRCSIGSCHEDDRLQRQAIDGARSMSSVPPIVHDTLQSPGQPFDHAMRAFFEPRFGQDFSAVRVHTDAKAADSARSVKARAYTVGREVIFGAGQYAPHTDAGRQLIAHELTHVVQQNRSASMMRSALTIGPADDAFEQEARQISHAISQTSSDFGAAPVAMETTPQPAARLMRDPDGSRTGDPCLDECEDQFDRCLKTTRFPPECIAGRSHCMGNCKPKTEEKPKPKEEPKKIKPEDIVIESRGRKEHVDPSKITQGLWWFNGAVPLLAPLYPNEATVNTGLPNGEFKYQVSQGVDKLALLDGSKEVNALTVNDQPAISVKGIGPSAKAKDVKLAITHTPTGAKSADVYSAQLEVRAPNHLDLMNCTHTANGAYGYTSVFPMKVMDNFGQSMAYIDVNEDFDAGTLEKGVSSDWDAPFKSRTKGSTLTLGDGTFEDNYAVGVSGGKPPSTMAPQPGNPQTPLGATLVGTFRHRWYVGTRTTGQGVNVSVHLGKFYADHGEYNNFTSPVSPAGTPVTCPAPAKSKP